MYYFGDFGQAVHPKEVVPHPQWGRGSRCWFPTSPSGTGGAYATFPGSSPGLLATCTRSGDNVECNDRELNAFANSIQDKWQDGEYVTLPDSAKKKLKTVANDVRTNLSQLKAKGETVLEEWETLEKAVGKSGGEMNQEVTDAWTNGQAGLMELSTQKYYAFLDIDMLSVYSPDAEAAVEMCKARLRADRSFQVTLDKVGEVSKEISKKIADYYQERDDWLAAIQKFFQMFLDALQALMNIILDAFKLVPVALGFLVKHPKVAIAAGVVIALGVVGFALRPYFAIFKMIGG